MKDKRMIECLKQPLLMCVICSYVISGCRVPVLSTADGIGHNPTETALGTSIQDENSIIQNRLLVLPSDCEHQRDCFWNVDLEKTTRSEFKDVLLNTFVSLRSDFSEDQEVAGIHTNMLSFGRVLFGEEPSTESLQGIELEVYPDQAQSDFDLSRISPASIIRAFGVPDGAFIQLSPDHIGFTVFLYYETPAFVFETRGKIQDDKMCLTLSDVEYVSLYRFRYTNVARNYIDSRIPEPPAIELATVIQQDVDELPGLAEELGNYCLALVPGWSIDTK